MTSATNQQAVIIRTERGLTISGTRISLYEIIDRNRERFDRNRNNAT